jgi:di- and tripeptidase
LYVINPYLDNTAGDIFSLAWSATLQTIYIGCQNTSLQWLDFRTPPITAAWGPGPSMPKIPWRRAHKFFNSYPLYEYKLADIHANNGSTSSFGTSTPVAGASGSLTPVSGEHLQIPAQNVIDSAHYGYVYCMALLPSPREGSDDPPPSEDRRIQLVTGSGDETVKVCLPFQKFVRVVDILVHSYGNAHPLGRQYCTPSYAPMGLFSLSLFVATQYTLAARMVMSRFGI